MEFSEFNIIVRPASNDGWLVCAPAISTAVGTGDTIFEAIGKWQDKIIIDAANEFVRDKMKR